MSVLAIHLGADAAGFAHVARCGAQRLDQPTFSIVSDPELVTCAVCKEQPRHLCIGDSAASMHLVCASDIRDASWSRGPTDVTCFDCLIEGSL